MSQYQLIRAGSLSELASHIESNRKKGWVLQNISDGMVLVRKVPKNFVQRFAFWIFGFFGMTPTEAYPMMTAIMYRESVVESASTPPKPVGIYGAWQQQFSKV
jgi:hypothetical protein